MKLYLTILLLIALQSIATGQNWEKLKGPITVEHRSNHISREGIFFIITGTGNLNVSSDQGANWTSYFLSNNQFNLDPIFKELNDTNIYIKYNHELFKFNKITKSLQLLNSNFTFINFSISNSGIIYGIDRKLLFISTDDAKTFTKKEMSITSEYVQSFGEDNNYLLSAGKGGFSVYKFDNDGSNLQDLSLITDQPMAFCTKSQNLFFIRGKKILRSDVSGNHSEELLEINCNEIKFISNINENLIVTVCADNIYHTNDGIKWLENRTLNNNLIKTSPKYNILNFSDNLNCMTFSGSESYFVNDLGFQLVKTSEISPNVENLQETATGALICKAGLRWFLSINKGNDWFDLTNNLDSTAKNSIHQVVQFRNGNLFANHNNQFFHSSDLGLTWKSINRPGFPFSTIFLSSNEELFFFNTTQRLLSTDEGFTWTTSITNHPKSKGYSVTLPMTLSISEILYQSIDDSIFYSKNLGLSWDAFRCTPKFGNEYAYMSGDNTILWEERSGTLSDYYLYYTKNYGQDKDSIQLPYPSYTIDYHNNIYLFNPGDYSIEILNIDTGPKEKILLPQTTKNLFLSKIYVPHPKSIYLTFVNGGIYKLIESTSIKGINTNSKFHSISFLPNPSDAKTKIILPEQFNNKLNNILIYTSQGLLINNFSAQGSEIELLNLNLSNGIYFINAISENGEKAIGKLLIR